MRHCDAMRRNIEKRSPDRTTSGNTLNFAENRMSIRFRTAAYWCEEEETERIIRKQAKTIGRPTSSFGALITRAYFAAKQQSGRLHDSLIAEYIIYVHYRLKFAPCALWQNFETKMYIFGRYLATNNILDIWHGSTRRKFENIALCSEWDWSLK